MKHASVSYTLAIFEKLYRELPPLVPKEVVQDMESALDQMRHNHSLSIEELEDTMIVFGKDTWAFRKAFYEFLDLYEGRMGESMLLQILFPELRKKYKEFVAHGGTFRDLHAGGPLDFFTPDERVALCEALVESRRALHEHAKQAVVSTDKEDYLHRVYEFQVILDDIEKRLDTLLTMADSEQEHPELATEIRDGVQTFEYGLCALDQHTSYDAVCRATEHYEGRRADKKAHIVL